MANHSRVTQTVIYYYSNPERFETDYWVALYGRHNRFDHSHLEGKQNKGVTLAVRLDSEKSRENHHRIDHNYFGPRPTLGSNGGETLRVGTSHYSRTYSRTVIENNYFDRCDGELEIISNKSGGNVYRGNVFYESRGTLTLRHGHDNLVESNVFYGNNIDHTGGIRVINKRQVVKNNYLEGLAGYRFGGALVLMNGVPNSPINRYDRVEDSVIENNSIVNSGRIQFAAGSDQERSAVPVRTLFANNLIYNDNESEVFAVYDDISGINFRGNVTNGKAHPVVDPGVLHRKFSMSESKYGLKVPVDSSLATVGIAKDLIPVEKEDVGVNWFQKPEKSGRFGYGKKIAVEPGMDTLSQAIVVAEDGDVLHLNPGKYHVSKILKIDKSLRLQGSGEVAISYERSTLFELVDGGSLSINDLSITGAEAPDYQNNSVIRTSRYSMLNNYEIEINRSNFKELDVNKNFNVIAVAKGTMADQISISHCTIEGVSGAVLKLDSEVDNIGIYNAEYVSISDSTFANISGGLIRLYRGGSDESTFGPHLDINRSNIKAVGNASGLSSVPSISLHGVQVANIANNHFIDSGSVSVVHTVGEPRTSVVDNLFERTELEAIEELYNTGSSTAIVENKFVD
ncbi:hypothetical protein GCM10025791_24540 [Halioxenophilus aromaticivorans]|uniref:Alginate lyase n=1 Tax=Halioxenophilus aromaticivorans TaxID=1306992 RepID=A0AAV3U2X2_9ALTE